MALKSQMVHLSQVSGNRFISSILYRRLIGISAAVYGARYISDRFLPDKAIDLVDEAASSLRLAQESKPDALEQLDRAVSAVDGVTFYLIKDGTCAWNCSLHIVHDTRWRVSSSWLSQCTLVPSSAGSRKFRVHVTQCPQRDE